MPSSTSAKIAWTARSLAGKAGTSLEIQRATGGGAFATLTSVSAPRRRGSIQDQPTAGGSYSYRARAVTLDGTSDWSPTVSVEIATPPVAGPPGDPALPAGLTECPAGYVDDVLKRVNDTRRSAGLGGLTNHAKLAKAARIRSIDMAASQNLSHTGWSTTIRAAGYTGGFLGENIAYGYATPSAVMTGWIRSSVHLANILGLYNDIGVGCVVDGRGRPWWTQDFGR